MKEACSFTILHHSMWITRAIDLPDRIPIGASTVGHESLEVYNFEAVPCHDFVEARPHDALGLTILGLHITDNNYHHPTIP